MNESTEFRLMVETPGLQQDERVAAIEGVAQKASFDPAVVNFLKVLVENRRLADLAKVIDIFESFYRAEKGLILCEVTSATALSSAQQGQVKAAMQQQAGQGATLIMSYNSNPAIIG